MLNIEALQRAVARWETYNDRGISPQQGQLHRGGDGNSCALGDISHYEGLDPSLSEGEVSDALGMPRIQPDEYTITAHGDTTTVAHLLMWHGFMVGPIGLGQILTDINDNHGRWPITELKRLVGWAIAERDFDLVHYQKAVDCATV